MLIKDWQDAVRTLEMSHGPTYYVDVGSGPAVVLLHGVSFTGGAHEWFQNVEALAANFRVIAPDFVGWGRGGRLERSYSFARLVDFVREFQDRLEIASSHIVGHSMGGWVASLLAYESPQRVERLVLVGSGGVGQRPLKMMTEFSPPSLEDAQAALAARTGLDRAEVCEWAEYGWRNVQSARAAESYLKIMRHMSDPETRAIYNTIRRLPHISAPTLVLWGSHDEVNELELGRETARLVPDSTLAVLDCGHFVPTQRPAEFNQHVGTFLATGHIDG